jgi:Transposase DNA-binding
MDQVAAGWSIREFAGLDLGDARLNRRLLTMAEPASTESAPCRPHRPTPPEARLTEPAAPAAQPPSV